MGKNKDNEQEVKGKGQLPNVETFKPSFQARLKKFSDFETFSTEKSEKDAETGARISTTYLERKQTVVGVSKDDLENLLSFDAREMGKFTFGMFLLSGSAWLLVEEIVRQQEFEITALVLVCALCVVFGLIFVGDGYLDRMRKRKIIKSIFSQTSQ